jgi:hypothetical protein
VAEEQQVQGRAWSADGCLAVRRLKTSSGTVLMKRRSKRRIPFAAYGALIFNAALCATPFMASRALSTAYGDHKPAFEATSEALAATRQAIDTRFQRLSLSGNGAPREIWANYVRADIEAGDMTSARGFLLAAPVMLRGEEGEALKARIAVSSASGEAAVLDAALAYLPDEVQDAYEQRTTSVVSLFDNNAPAEAIPASAPVEETVEDSDSGYSQFSVLGDLRDLSLQAARWAREDRIDEFTFVLSGVGLVLADPAAADGASVLLSARRAQRLDPDFQIYLERKLFEAAPPQRLKRMLMNDFQTEFGYGATGPAVVENAFRSSANTQALEELLSDLRVIRDIARDTSPLSAVAILAPVEDGHDLRAARLVAVAGGDRAVTLARYSSDNLLSAAKTTITWSNALRLQLAGLAACALLLGFIAMTTLWKSFTRNSPVRRSAVYALEEVLPG